MLWIRILVSLVLATNVNINGVNSSTSASPTRYDGDVVLEVFIKDDIQKNSFEELLIKFAAQVSRWRSYVQNDAGAHIYVSSSAVNPFTSELKQHQLEYRVLISNIQRFVEEEASSNQKEGLQMPWERRGRDKKATDKIHKAKRSPLGRDKSIVGKYTTYEQMVSWLYALQRHFPTIVKVRKIGMTYELRDIILLQIRFDDGAVRKPGVWIEAGTHAREWISPASAIFIIARILTAYYSMTSEYSVVRQVDWYIVPLLNPDGYVFSYSPHGHRFWRKNRSQYGVNNRGSYSSVYNQTCFGTDINRNYDFHWGEVYAGKDPCSEMYRGPSAASEYETRAVMWFLNKNRNVIKAYMTLHSYSQMLLTRWSFTGEYQPPEFNRTLKVIQEAVRAIKNTHGTNYLYGLASQLLYTFSGGSGDWARQGAGIKHSYEVELRDRGHFGFLLPANYIIPVGEEIWAGIKVIVNHVVEENPWIQVQSRWSQNYNKNKTEETTTSRNVTTTTSSSSTTSTTTTTVAMSSTSTKTSGNKTRRAPFRPPAVVPKRGLPRIRMKHDVREYDAKSTANSGTGGPIACKTLAASMLLVMLLF